MKRKTGACGKINKLNIYYLENFKWLVVSLILKTFKNCNNF